MSFVLSIKFGWQKPLKAASYIFFWLVFSFLNTALLFRPTFFFNPRLDSALSSMSSCLFCRVVFGSQDSGTSCTRCSWGVISFRPFRWVGARQSCLFVFNYWDRIDISTYSLIPFFTLYFLFSVIVKTLVKSINIFSHLILLRTWNSFRITLPIIMLTSNQLSSNIQDFLQHFLSLKHIQSRCMVRALSSNLNFLGVWFLSIWYIVIYVYLLSLISGFWVSSRWL